MRDFKITDEVEREPSWRGVINRADREPVRSEDTLSYPAAAPRVDEGVSYDAERPRKRRRHHGGGSYEKWGEGFYNEGIFGW